MSENNGDFGAFLAGFVIGGLVGAAAALVLAPQSGRETRLQISGKGHEVIDATEQRYHSAVESAGSYAQHVGERASQIGQEMETQARIILDSGRESTHVPNETGSASSAEAGDEVAPAAD